MAYVQADVDALKEAIATGARRVRYADGREVEYRTLAEMKTLLADMQAEVTPPTNPSRCSLAWFSRD